MLRLLQLKLFKRRKIPGTKLKANTELQQNFEKPTHLYISSYYSEEIVCRDCGIIFIHSAQDKKEYYEGQKGNIYKKFVRCAQCDKIKHPERYKA